MFARRLGRRVRSSRRPDGRPVFPSYDISELAKDPRVEIAYFKGKGEIPAAAIRDFDALVLMGEEDRLCPRDRHELMAALMPQARVEVIPDDKGNRLHPSVVGFLPGGDESRPTAINAAGQISGYAYTATEVHAFLYSGGSLIVMPWTMVISDGWTGMTAPSSSSLTSIQLAWPATASSMTLSSNSATR